MLGAFSQKLVLQLMHPSAFESAFRARHVRCSIVVSISACHAEDPGSIPGGGVLFDIFALRSLGTQNGNTKDAEIFSGMSCVRTCKEGRNPVTLCAIDFGD